MTSQMETNWTNKNSSPANVMNISSLITSPTEESQLLVPKLKKKPQLILSTTTQVEEPAFDPSTNVIDIEIPISTHYDIHTEFNFPWLMEEKYGIGPTSIMNSKWQADDNRGVAVDEDGADDGADDEEEDEEDEESSAIPAGNSTGPPVAEDDFIVPDDAKKSTTSDDHAIVKLLGIQFDKKMTDLEKETLVLNALNKREAKNNQRLGKYDVYDPFIDDEELEVEEQGSHVEGWFIWTGELADSNGTDIAKIIEKEQQRNENIVGAGTSTGSNSNPDVIEIKDISEPKKRRSDNGPSPTEALEPVKKRKRVRPVAKSNEREETPEISVENSVDKSTEVTPSETLSPAIIEKGPVVASSKTSSNQIIIGSFTGFSSS